MNINSIKAFIEKIWDESAIPALKDYIAIPAVSPFFAPDWKSSGFLTDALRLAETWLKGMALENARIQILSPEDRTSGQTAPGPNEFLDLPYVKKLTQALSLIIANP